MLKILVTGSAGFIGFHLAKHLLEDGHSVVGIDNINNYYDVQLKYDRLAETGIFFPQGKDSFADKNWPSEPIQSKKYSKYKFWRLNLEDKSGLSKLFASEEFEIVINLAAQVGVRSSAENPDLYVQSNIVGFMNVLEACRHSQIKHLIYASSSSVYGANTKIPFSEKDTVENPISIYAATKKSNELMAYAYSHLFSIPTTGLRFFTVYGPWGRPDMAPMLFAKAISKGMPIKVFNNGEMERDFTYVDDIIEAIVRIIPFPPQVCTPNQSGGPSEHSFCENKTLPKRLRPGIGTEEAAIVKPAKAVPYSIFNIGNGAPVNLMSFINTLEEAIGKRAKKILMPIQDGDLKQTWADTNSLENEINYKPEMSLEDGIGNFVKWYNSKYSES